MTAANVWAERIMKKLNKAAPAAWEKILWKEIKSIQADDLRTALTCSPERVLELMNTAAYSPTW